MKKKLVAALCDDDTLDSRKVGEQASVLPGYVQESGHHEGIQKVQSVMIGPFDDTLSLQLPGLLFLRACERIIKSTRHYTP